jgi:hypothetical protein
MSLADPDGHGDALTGRKLDLTLSHEGPFAGLERVPGSTQIHSKEGQRGFRSRSLCGGGFR